MIWNQKNGFTIVEVVISSLIFVIAVAGIFASINLLRKPAEDTTDKINAAFVGKEILEGLRKQVDAASWQTGDLTVGTHALNTISVDGVTYTPSYTVSDDPDTSARKVTLSINWI